MTHDELKRLEESLASRDQGDLGGLQGIPNDIQVQQTPGRIAPAPYQPIDQAQQYQPLASPNEQPGLDPIGLPGWSDTPEQGGLGLAGRGAQPQESLSLADRYAREVFPGMQEKLGFWDRARANEAIMNGGLNHLATARQAAAHQVAQIEEQKRQHDLQMIEKLMATGNMDALIEYGKKNPNSPAGLIGQSLSKQHLADVAMGIQEGLIPDEVMQRIVSKQATPTEIRAWGDSVVEIRKANAKEQAKAYHLKRAMDTPVEQRTPYQQQLADEHQQALDLKNADETLKRAQAAKAWMEAERGPIDHSEMNKTHESMFGKPWAQGSLDSQSKARDATWRGRTQAHTDVTSDTPVGQLGKSQEYRDPVTGHAAPAWATQKQLQQMGYVNIEPTQVQTISQLRNVDEAMKEVLGAGTALVRKATGSSLFDIPAGFLQTKIVDLTKKYAGDPNAALLQSALSRIAPSMAKLAGDTGNIAVAEQQIYKDAVFSGSDTLESFATKIKSILQAQKRTRASLGFVDDEKSYIRRLAIQGKTDDQIKAIIEERKRMQ